MLPVFSRETGLGQGQKVAPVLSIWFLVRAAYCSKLTRGLAPKLFVVFVEHFHLRLTIFIINHHVKLTVRVFVPMVSLGQHMFSHNPLFSPLAMQDIENVSHASSVSGSYALRNRIAHHAIELHSRNSFFH